MVCQVPKQNTTGFSLIEVLVSMAIFTFVAVASVGVLLVMIDANAKAQNTQSVMTNLSFAVDSMTREIRTGTHYDCADSRGGLADSGSATRDCTVGGGWRGISFNEASGNLTASCSSSRISYWFNQTQNRIERRLCDGDWLPLTSPEVEINDLRFFVTGTDDLLDDADTISPLVTIFIKGSATGVSTRTGADFSVQTSVTQYILDI